MLNRDLPYVNAYGTVDISSADSIKQALILADMDWNVDSKLLYDENGNEIPGFRANTRSDNGKLLGIVSDRYHIIQNEEAFDFVNELPLQGDFKFESAGEFRDGKSMWVMGSLPEVNILGDDVSNNLVFVNSHDGSSGVKVMMTPIRIICSNMLNLATKKANRIWAAKHTTNITSRMEEARHTLDLANKYMIALVEEADELSNTKVTDAEIEAILDAMFPVDYNKDTARKINNVILFKNNFFSCYNESDIAQFKGTAWGAINAMADLIDHKDPNRNTSSYYSNHWNKLICGHEDFDRFYNAIKR